MSDVIVSLIIAALSISSLWLIIVQRRLKVRLRDLSTALITLERMANYDHLTSLPNRRLLFDQIDRSISRARRNQGRVCICVLDLDHFKPINDQAGHPSGDAVLVDVASRLSGWVRASDAVGRLGGDEFCFITEDVRSHEDAEILINRLRTIFEKPFFVGNENYKLSFSCGVAFYPEDGTDRDALLSTADKRMYTEKTIPIL